jgi:hypothetical protein
MEPQITEGKLGTYHGGHGGTEEKKDLSQRRRVPARPGTGAGGRRGDCKRGIKAQNGH